MFLNGILDIVPVVELIRYQYAYSVLPGKQLLTL